MDRLLAMEEAVDDFMARKGVLIPHSEAETYLTIKRDEMDRMSPDEVGVAGYELARHAFHLQTIVNFYRRRIRMCDDEIRRLVGHKLGRYSVYGREEKWIAAIADNPTALGWRAIRETADHALATVEEYPARVQQMSRAALDLQHSRRQSYGKI